RRLKVDPLRFARCEPEGEALVLAVVDVEHDIGRRPSRLQPRVEHPGPAQPVEPGAVVDEGRLVTLDPLYQLDIAEMAFAAPACRRVRGWGVMNPHPARHPNRGRLVELFL